MEKPSRRDFGAGTTEKKATTPVSEKVQAELEKLSQKIQVTTDDWRRLKEKYPNDDKMVAEIFRLNAKRYRKFKNKMHDLVDKLYTKHKFKQAPLHEILEKMIKVKNDHGWSDAYFEEFRKTLTDRLSGSRVHDVVHGQYLNKSRINYTLGSPRFEQGELHIKESEHGILNDILTMNEQYAPLHHAAFINSLIYTDCNIVALTGEFKRERHIAQNYISPLLACMFIPKFEIFEYHMIMASFGSIIKSRHEKRPIMNEADNLLFYDITSDPNDVVCEISSPITDLRNRFRVQVALWGIIQKIRNGNYYEAESTNQFLTTLNACRNNLFYNAGSAFSQDEGAMLKRLLSVFSLRPTLIKTNTINSLAAFMGGPNCLSGMPGISSYANAGSFSSAPIYTITSIPFLEICLPPNVSDSSEPIDINTAFNQTVWINEKGTLIPRQQQILHSKEVLIFYVNRRVSRVTIKTFTNPISFNQLPSFISNVEKLNDYPLAIHPHITVRHAGDTYDLRSVVAVSDTEITLGGKSEKIITGSIGLIAAKQGLPMITPGPNYYRYDPLGPILPIQRTDASGATGYVLNKPITQIPGVIASNPETQGQCFYDIAMSAGTIFIYAKPNGYNINELITV